MPLPLNILNNWGNYLGDKSSSVLHEVSSLTGFSYSRPPVWKLRYSVLAWCKIWTVNFTSLWLGSSTSSEKAVATHSSTVAWKIPWMEGPGRLQSMGSLRVEHDWATSLLLFTFMHWREKWHPTPVLLPGESQGRGSLLGSHLWGHKELDMTEVT